jgi:TIR domain-containing protein
MFWLRYDVFLSYSHRDVAKTDALVAALRKRGYRVFYDTQSLVVGERWKERLSRAIGLSRVCLLCWSESAQRSEIVTYEYSRAEGLRKPVLPWLLDGTPLPQMIEIQGVTAVEPQDALARLVPRLGWRLTRIRLALAAVLAVALAAAGWGIAWRLQPPPPWEFSGRVVDRETRLPLEGVEVDAEEHRFVTYTDRDGRYVLRMPQPKPKYLHLVFAKEGYLGEDSVTVLPDHSYNPDMTRLEQAKP